MQAKSLKKKRREVNLERRAEIGRERRERTRTIIVSRSFEVVAEKGFDTPTIDDFVAAAGVARGTFYNYFETREELLAAIAADVVDELDLSLVPIYASIADPAQRMAVALRHFVRMSEVRPVWGWIIVRMLPVAGGPLSKEMLSGVLADLTAGQKSGRFRFPSLEAAVAAGMGILLMAIRTTLAGRVPPDFAISMATMVLLSLGMSADEARKAASIPLPKTLDAAAASVRRKRSGTRTATTFEWRGPKVRTST